MRPSFSFSRLPCLSLSLSNLFHLVPSSYPVSLFFTPSSSLLVSHSLLRKRLVSSSSRFPSLPSPHAAIAGTAAATTHRRRAPLSGFARSSSSHPPPLFIFLRPSGLLVALSVHRTYTHTLRHSYMYTHEHCVLVCLPLADYLPQSFFTLSQPLLASFCLCLSQLVFRESSLSPLPGESSLPDAPNLPPEETGFHQPYRRPSRLSSGLSSPTSPSWLKVGEERASVPRRSPSSSQEFAL